MSDRLLLARIGTLLSGDVNAPIIEADAVLIENGVIAAIGETDDLHGEAPEIDVAGATVLPGLIDNHVHPVMGDYTPRSSQSGYLEGFVHGGVTSVVSAGEVHTPGRPKDPAGTKALAVLAHKAFQTHRPGGARVHAGAVLLEPGLVEEDFRELARHGVHLVGEIGISGVQDVDEAAEMTRWAQAAGMTVMVHVGGKSVPTSRTIDGDFCIKVKPDVAGHVNGGPTAASLEDVERILDETNAFVEIVFNGNSRAARDIAELLLRRGHVHRLVIGSDSPAGAGLAPGAVFRTLCWLSALADLPPALAVAAATGNTARARRIPGGRIEVGAVGDVVITDAPDGSFASDACAAIALGDTPAVAGVVIEGEVVVRKSRNTAPSRRKPTFPPL
jgi:enamidase